MKSKESLDVFKKYYLKEFTFFDGENNVIFNIELQHITQKTTLLLSQIATENLKSYGNLAVFWCQKT